MSPAKHLHSGFWWWIILWRIKSHEYTEIYDSMRGVSIRPRYSLNDEQATSSQSDSRVSPVKEIEPCFHRVSSHYRWWSSSPSHCPTPYHHCRRNLPATNSKLTPSTAREVCSTYFYSTSSLNLVTTHQSTSPPFSSLGPQIFAGARWFMYTVCVHSE